MLPGWRVPSSLDSFVADYSLASSILPVVDCSFDSVGLIGVIPRLSVFILDGDAQNIPLFDQIDDGCRLSGGWYGRFNAAVGFDNRVSSIVDCSAVCRAAHNELLHTFYGHDSPCDAGACYGDLQALCNCSYDCCVIDTQCCKYPHSDMHAVGPETPCLHKACQSIFNCRYNACACSSITSSSYFPVTLSSFFIFGPDDRVRRCCSCSHDSRKEGDSYVPLYPWSGYALFVCPGVGCCCCCFRPRCVVTGVGCWPASCCCSDCFVCDSSCDLFNSLQVGDAGDRYASPCDCDFHVGAPRSGSGCAESTLSSLFIADSPNSLAGDVGQASPILVASLPSRLSFPNVCRCDCAADFSGVMFAPLDAGHSYRGADASSRTIAYACDDVPSCVGDSITKKPCCER